MALITGAGSGIGRATAKLFSANGSPVVVADIDRAGGEETVAQIRQAGGRRFSPRWTSLPKSKFAG